MSTLPTASESEDLDNPNLRAASSAEHSVSARTVASSVVWRAAETLGNEVISFAVFTALARVLAPEHFGTVALAGSILMMLQGVLYNGFTEALVQRDVLDDRHVRAVQAASALLAVLLVFLGLAAAFPLSWALHRPEFVLVFSALLPSLLFRAFMGSMLAALRRRFDFRAIAIRTLLGVSVAGGAALWLAVSGAGYWALVAQQWSAEVVGFAVLAYVSSAKPWRLRWDTIALKEILPVALPVMGAHLMSNAARRLDAIALGLFLGDHDVGIYFMVYRLVYSAQMVTQHGLGEVSMVVLARMQNDKNRQQVGTVRVLQLITMVSCAAFGGLAIAGPWLVPMLFGEAWRAAGEPLKVLASLTPAGGVVATCGVILVAAGRANRFGWLASAAALLQLAAVFGAAAWGLQAVAWAAGLSQVIALVFALRMVSTDLNLPAGRILAALVPVGVIYGLGLIAANLCAHLTDARGGATPTAAFVLVVVLGAWWRLGADMREMFLARK